MQKKQSKSQPNKQTKAQSKQPVKAPSKKPAAVQSKKQKKKRRFPLKEVLISLGVTLALLGAVVGVSFWYQWARNVILDPLTMIICDAVGFVLMFFIVFYFVRKPADSDQ